MEKREIVVSMIAVLIMAVAFYFIVYTQPGIITGFAVYTPGPGEGETTLTLQDADTDNLGDAYVGSGGDAEKNFGSLNLLKTGSVARSYLMFNISSIPDNQAVDNASLCLYLTTKKIQLINVNHVYTSFDESTITWNNQPCGTDFDNSENCNLTEEDSFQADSGLENTWMCWNITDMIGEEYGSGGETISIVLHTSDSEINSFYSKEYVDSDYWPYLNVTYHTANSAPSLVLVAPGGGDAYGYNENIALNFIVSDEDDNLDSCLYNIDDGANVSIDGCVNTTFNVVGNGDYGLNIFASDTEGEIVGQSALFSVVVGAPTISLSSPVDVYLDSGDVEFVYTATDLDLEYCDLWGNFTGSYELSQTDSEVVSGIEDSFSLSLDDGGYMWNVGCDDAQGNYVFNGNQTFYVDTTNPGLSLIEPTGAKTSRSVSALWEVSDASPISCIYNIYQGASIEVANNSVACSDGLGSFDVSADADYVFNFYVSDSAGNENAESLSFSVDTSTPQSPSIPSPSSPSGSTGGSFKYTPPIVKSNIEITGLGDIIVYPGERKTLELEVKNNGKSFLNDCKIVGGGLVESNDLKNIDVGEIVEFGFILNVPNFVEELLDIYFECIDDSVKIDLNIVFVEPDLNVEISEMVLESKNELMVRYIVGGDLLGNIDLVFAVLSDENVISERVVSVGVGEGEVVLDISDAKEGMLKISINRQNGDGIVVDEFFVYDKSMVTGFVAKALSSNVSYIGIIGVLFLIGAFFIGRRIWGHKKRKR